MNRFLALLLSSFLAACSSLPTATAPRGDDPVSRRIAEVWLPKTQSALAAFAAFQQQNALPALAPALHFELVHTRDEQASGDAIRILIDSESSGSALYWRTVQAPLRRLLLAQQEALAGDHNLGVPDWFAEGCANLLSEQIALGMDTVEARLFVSRQHTEEVLRRDKPRLEFNDLFAEQHSEFEVHYAAQAWLARQLADFAGPAFVKNWKAYFQQAGRAGFAHEKAFEQSFGLSPGAFRTLAESHFKALQAEQRQHREPVPAASGYARHDDLGVFPFDSWSSLRSGYEKYLKARAPKAFAFSPRGAWVYSDDDADAMHNALALCNHYDTDNCRLYAADHSVVYRPPAANEIKATVRMFGKDDEAWARLIRQDWLPVAQTAATHFLEAIRTQAGTGLSSNTSILLTASREDFARALREELGVLNLESTHFEEFSSGVSNGDGSIAIYLKSSTPPEQRLETLTETVLHELVHELQGQLTRNRRGFAPAYWLTEGSAEELAARIGASMPGETGRLFELDARRTRLKHAYRLQALPDAQEIFSADRTKWQALSSQRAQHYAAAELMTCYLGTRLGDKFLPALVDYFRRAGTKGETEASAFYLSFGLSRDEFISGYRKWLDSN